MITNSVLLLNIDILSNLEAQVIPDYTLAIIGVGIAMILAFAIVGVLLYRKK